MPESLWPVSPAPGSARLNDVVVAAGDQSFARPTGIGEHCAVWLHRGRARPLSGVFPGESWERRHPADVGLEVAGLEEFAKLARGRGCVVRRGYLVHSWGDMKRSSDVASASKPFYSHLLLRALEEGHLASPDARVVTVEPCLRDLNEDLDQVNVAAFGSIVGAELDLRPWGVRIEGGLATGDGQLGDQNLRTFTFDPDYSIGLMLFEHPLPTLAQTLGTAANQNRNFDQAITGQAVSNALYLKPTLRREIVEGLDVSAAWLGARVAKVPDAFGDRRSYGMEVQLGARYTGIEHVDVGLLLGTFLPGSYYTNLGDDDYPGFEAPAFGGQLSTRIHF